MRLGTLSIPAEAEAGATNASGMTAAITLRKFSPCIPTALVIAASTGGPQALLTVLEGLAPHISRIPVFIVLHMPADFTSVITNQIARVTSLETRAPAHGEQPKPGWIYVAPGDTHMRLLRMGDMPVICHADGPPENFCKPAADVLFRSAAQTYRVGALGLVLTGMGADGLAGSRAIVEAGGSIIAQDEASSVVWGMPGAVATAGLAAAVLPVTSIAQTIGSLMLGMKPRSAT